MCVLIKDLRRSGVHVCANKGLSEKSAGVGALLAAPSSGDFVGALLASRRFSSGGQLFTLLALSREGRKSKGRWAEGFSE